MMPSREITVPSKEKSQQSCRRTDGEKHKKAEERWKRKRKCPGWNRRKGT